MKRYIEIASRMREERHPDSHVVFLAGSLMRGEGTSYSDLDIVVIYDAMDKAYRESFLFEGIMIETFVHDPETFDYFLKSVDGPVGNPTLALMVAEGVEIPAASPLSQDLKRHANEWIAEGPAACGERQIMNMRYAITNLVDDLREYRTESELLGTLAELYSALSEFYFKANRRWIGKSKHVSRSMRKIDPELESRFSKAFAEANASKETGSVIEISEEILMPFGGFLFDGYRFDATEKMRIRKGERSMLG